MSTQEAFAQLHVHWKKVSTFQRPDAWVRRVAIRLAVRYAKRESRRKELERETEPANPSVPVDVDLLRAVATLPVMQRAVVALFYFEDRPMTEIAHILSISEATGYVHLHRARRSLGELLSEEVTENAVDRRMRDGFHRSAPALEPEPQPALERVLARSRRIRIMRVAIAAVAIVASVIVVTLLGPGVIDVLATITSVRLSPRARPGSSVPTSST